MDRNLPENNIKSRIEDKADFDPNLRHKTLNCRRDSQRSAKDKVVVLSTPVSYHREHLTDGWYLTNTLLVSLVEL